MNTPVILSSLVVVVGTTVELSLTKGVSEHIQLAILGVTMLAFSSVLRGGFRLGRRPETT
jgi:hypothetical protein